MSFILGGGFGPGSTGAGVIQTRDFPFQMTVDGARNAHMVTPMKVGNNKKYTISAIFKHADKDFNIVTAFNEINNNFSTCLKFVQNKERGKDTENHILFEQKEASTTIFKVAVPLRTESTTSVSVVVQVDTSNPNESDRIRIFINTIGIEPTGTPQFPQLNRATNFFSNNQNLQVFGTPGYEYFVANGVDLLNMRQTGTVMQITVLNDVIARPSDLVIFESDSSGRTAKIILRKFQSAIDDKSIDLEFKTTYSPGSAFQTEYMGMQLADNELGSSNQFDISVDKPRFFSIVTGRDNKIGLNDVQDSTAIDPAVILFRDTSGSTKKQFDYIYPLNTFDSLTFQESYTQDLVNQNYYPYVINDSLGGFGNKKIKFGAKFMNRNYGYRYTVLGAQIDKNYGVELVELNKHYETTNTFHTLPHNLARKPDAVLVFQDGRMIFSDASTKKQNDCQFALNSENVLSNITNYNEGVTTNDLVDWDATDSSNLVIKQQTRFPKVFDDGNVFIAPSSKQTITNISLVADTFQIAIPSAIYSDIDEELNKSAQKPSDIIRIKAKTQSRTDAFIYSVKNDTGTVKTIEVAAEAIRYNQTTKENTAVSCILRYDFDYSTNNQKLQQGVALLLKNTIGRLNIQSFDSGSADNLNIATNFIPKFGILISKSKNLPAVLLQDITLDGCRVSQLKTGKELISTSASVLEKIKINPDMKQVTLFDLDLNTKYQLVLFADQSTLRGALVDSSMNNVFQMVNMSGIASVQNETTANDYVKFLHPKNYLKVYPTIASYQNSVSRVFDLDEMGTLLIPDPEKTYTTTKMMKVKTEKFTLNSDADTSIDKYFEFFKIRDKVDTDNVPDSNWVLEIKTIHNQDLPIADRHGKLQSIAVSQDCFVSVDSASFQNFQNQYMRDSDVIGVEIYRKKIIIYANGIARYERNFTNTLPKNTKVEINFSIQRGSLMQGSQFNLKTTEQELPKFKFNFGCESFTYPRQVGIHSKDVQDVTLISQDPMFDQRIFTGTNTNKSFQLDFEPDLIMIREVQQDSNVQPLIAWDRSDVFKTVVPMQFQSVNRVTDPAASTDYGKVIVEGRKVTVFSGAGTDVVNVEGKLYIMFAFKQHNDFFKIYQYSGDGNALGKTISVDHKSEFGFIFQNLQQTSRKLRNYFKPTATSQLQVCETQINGQEANGSEAISQIGSNTITVKGDFNQVGEVYTIYQFTSMSGHMSTGMIDVSNNAGTVPYEKSYVEQLSTDFIPEMIWMKSTLATESFVTSKLLPGNQKALFVNRIDNYSNQLVSIQSTLKGISTPPKITQNFHVSQQGAQFAVQTSTNNLAYYFVSFGKPGYRRQFT